jgi:predicted nucleic acid-binding protein
VIFVDSSIWITIISRAETRYTADLRDAISTGNVAIADLVLMEVLRGATSDPAAQKLLQQMAAFPVVQIGGREVAIKAAAHYRALRALGITVRSTIDLVLATYCIEGRHTLLHGDRDFDHFARFGLDAINAGSAASR